MTNIDQIEVIRGDHYVKIINKQKDEIIAMIYIDTKGMVHEDSWTGRYWNKIESIIRVNDV